MYQGNRLQAAVNDGLELRAHVAKEFETEMKEANRGAVSAKGFALEAQRIAVGRSPPSGIARAS